MRNGKEELLRSDVFDRGIPSDIRTSLIQFFKKLDIFQSDEALREFITDECTDLYVWKSKIKEASSAQDRATLLIALLVESNHFQRGNTLLIFLKYLEDKKNCDFSDILKSIK